MRPIVSTLLFFHLTGLALAQHHSKPPEDPQASLARQHYEKGVTNFNLAEYDQAIDEFKQAYTLTQEPGLLFNLAQAYRAKGDIEQALTFFGTYLNMRPKAPNRADVETAIAELERQRTEKEQQSKESAPAPAPTPPPAPTPMKLEPAPALAAPIMAQPSEEDRVLEQKRGHRKVWIGLTTAGAGVAVLATGVVFGARASSSADDVAKVTQWTPSAQSMFDDGQSKSRTATILMAGGGALVAGGALLTYLGWRQERSASVAWIPLRGGAAIALGNRF